MHRHAARGRSDETQHWASKLGADRKVTEVLTIARLQRKFFIINLVVCTVPPNPLFYVVFPYIFTMGEKKRFKVPQEKFSLYYLAAKFVMRFNQIIYGKS